MTFHPVHYLRVASHFWPWERAFWLALMHDSIEDGWATVSGLSWIFTARFCDEVDVLTRYPQSSIKYADYIYIIADTGGDVIRVKRADLAENYARAPASLRRRYATAMTVLADD